MFRPAILTSGWEARGGLNMNGVSGSGTINANNWLGVAGDLGYYHASPGGVGFNTVTYTVGPRFSYRMPDSVIPVVPFAEALIGGASFGVVCRSERNVESVCL